MNRLPAPKNIATFLLRTLTVVSDMNHMVYLGSDAGIEVYLNCKSVHRNNTERGPVPNQKTLKLKLRAGENQLLLKIYNSSDDQVCYFSTSPKPGAGNQSPAALRCDELFALIERDYTYAEEVREIPQEQADGIWD